MAFIDNFIKIIREGRYGRDIRGAIADGLEEIDGLTNTAMSGYNNAQSAANNALTLANQALAQSSAPPVFATILLASDWVDGKYTLESSHFPASTETLETVVSMPPLTEDFEDFTKATDAQVDAWLAADIGEYEAAEGAYTIIANGTVPTVDIPIIVRVTRETKVTM